MENFLGEVEIGVLNPKISRSDQVPSGTEIAGIKLMQIDVVLCTKKSRSGRPQRGKIENR